MKSFQLVIALLIIAAVLVFTAQTLHLVDPILAPAVETSTRSLDKSSTTAFEIPSGEGPPSPSVQSSLDQSLRPSASGAAPLVVGGQETVSVAFSSGCEWAESLLLTLRQVGTDWAESKETRGANVLWRDLSPGAYALHGKADALQLKTAEFTLIDQGVTTELTLDVIPLNRVTGVIVAGNTGFIPPEVTLILSSRWLGGGGLPTKLLPQSITVAPDKMGRFCVAGWAGVSASADEIRFSVQAEGFTEYVGDWIPTASPPAFEVSDLLFELQSAATIVAQVVDDATSTPVQAASVRLRVAQNTSQSAWVRDGQMGSRRPKDAQASPTLRTDSSGWFNLPIDAPAEGRVEIIHPQYAPYLSARFALAMGERLQTTFRLPSPGRVEGHVESPDAEAESLTTSPSRVVLIPLEGSEPIAGWRAKVNEKGHFAIEAVRAGGFTLSLEGTTTDDRSMLMQRRSVEVHEGETTWVTLHIGSAKGIPVYGQVLAAGDWPLMALLINGNTGQPTTSPVPVASDGSFLLRAPNAESTLCAVGGSSSGNEHYTFCILPVELSAGTALPTLLFDTTRSTLRLKTEDVRPFRWQLKATTGQPDIDRVLGLFLGQQMPPSTRGSQVLHGLPSGSYVISGKPLNAQDSAPTTAATVFIAAAGSTVSVALPRPDR